MMKYMKDEQIYFLFLLQIFLQYILIIILSPPLTSQLLFPASYWWNFMVELLSCPFSAFLSLSVFLLSKKQSKTSKAKSTQLHISPWSLKSTSVLCCPPEHGACPIPSDPADFPSRYQSLQHFLLRGGHLCIILHAVVCLLWACDRLVCISLFPWCLEDTVSLESVSTFGSCSLNLLFCPHSSLSLEGRVWCRYPVECLFLIS